MSNDPFDPVDATWVEPEKPHLPRRSQKSPASAHIRRLEKQGIKLSLHEKAAITAAGWIGKFDKAPVKPLNALRAYLCIACVTAVLIVIGMRT